MVIATLVGSSLGASIAYAFNSKDSFHIVDIMSHELPKDDPKQMAMIYKKLKAAYEKEARVSQTSAKLFRVRL